VLRWLDALTLEGLERVVLVSPLLQRFVTTAHERALRRLRPDVLSARSVLIVGGGLYPRTAIVLRRLLPEATLTILDARADHLAVARTFLDDGVILREGWFAGSAPPDVDLVVVPLAYVGDRGRIYARPPGRATLVHDWIWSRHGESAVVSPWLLKRVNLVVAVGCGERLTDVRMSA
jgi:hypothetical protein